MGLSSANRVSITCLPGAHCPSGWLRITAGNPDKTETRAKQLGSEFIFREYGQDKPGRQIHRSIKETVKCYKQSTKYTQVGTLEMKKALTVVQYTTVI